ncbi:MAG: HAMP domain-containing sensor histidine kinase [Pseudomonadota bacterium]
MKNQLAQQDRALAQGQTAQPRRDTRLFWRSLSARLLLVSVLWVGLFLIGGSIIFSQLFSDYLTDALDDRLSQSSQALIGAAQISSEGELSFERSLGEARYEQPYSGYYWQVGGEGAAPVRSRSLWDQVLQVDYETPWLEAHYSMRYGPDGQRLRVLERDVNLPGAGQPYRFLVTGNFDEINEALSRFHRTLFWAMGLLGLGLMGAVGVQIGYGLKPLRRVRKAVSAIRTGKEGRIPEDMPPEVMPLVGEMNALLDQSEDTVERAKTQAGNLAHALKTPLSILTNEAESTDGRLSATVQKQVALMRRHIDHNLARARAASHYGRTHVSADVNAVASTIVRVISKLHGGHQIAFDSQLESPASARIARQDLEEILGNVIENAAKFGAGRVRVEVAEAAVDDLAAISVTIEDDGPGIPVEERAAIFTRGKRLDESVPGTGLGLSIVTDLLDVHGGTIALESGKTLPGLRAVITLRKA